MRPSCEILHFLPLRSIPRATGPIKRRAARPGAGPDAAAGGLVPPTAGADPAASRRAAGRRAVSPSSHADPPTPPRAGGEGGARSWLSSPDGGLHTRIRGRGPPVLCLHGISAHGGVWDRAVHRVEEEFTLHVPDLLGRGVSEPGPGARYGLDDEGARTAVLASRLPHAGYLVAGHSQGAALAVALAAAAEPGSRNPASGAADAAGERAGPPPAPAGLLLVNPVTPWTRRPRSLDGLRFPPLRAALAPVLAAARRPLTRWVLQRRAFGDPSRVDPGTVGRYAAPWSETRRARALLRILADWRPAELSRHLPRRPPAGHVLAGGRDVRIRPLEARRWAGRLGAAFSLAPRAGHVLPEERPDLVARALRRLAERTGLSG